MTVTPTLPAGDGPAAYDFRRPMTLAREHTRLLDIALGTFSRQWANQLLASLRVPTQVIFDRVVMCSYEEYITALPSPTTMVLCAAGPNRRAGLIQFPLDAALSWIDHMLGGRGTPGAVAERVLTELEQELVSEVMTRVLADLDYSFAGILRFDAELRHIRHSPQLMQATAAGTVVIVATFTITVEEHAVTATLMLPAEGLVAAMAEREDVETRTPEEVAAEQAQRDLLHQAVQRAPVEVSVRLAPVAVHPREIADLAVGDLIPLRHPSSLPMDVVVADRVLAQAVAGTNRSRLAGLVVNVKENS